MTALSWIHLKMNRKLLDLILLKVLQRCMLNYLCQASVHTGHITTLCADPTCNATRTEDQGTSAQCKNRSPLALKSSQKSQQLRRDDVIHPGTIGRVLSVTVFSRSINDEPSGRGASSIGTRCRADSRRMAPPRRGIVHAIFFSWAFPSRQIKTGKLRTVDT